MSANKDKEIETKFEKFANGCNGGDEVKKSCRDEITQLIQEKKLFVGPVQSHNRGHYRAEAYNVIHPIYKSDDFREALPNCYACKECAHIFLHSRTKGTAPFTHHKCFKTYKENVQKAEVLSEQAKKLANEAAVQAELAKKSVENIRQNSSGANVQLNDSADEAQLAEKSVENIRQNTSGANVQLNDLADEAQLTKKSVENIRQNSSGANVQLNGSADEDSRNTQQKEAEEMDTNQTPRHAEIIANAIEYFVGMALRGKVVSSADLIHHIPNDFTPLSWKLFMEKMEKNTPYRMKNARVVLNRIEHQSTSVAESSSNSGHGDTPIAKRTRFAGKPENPQPIAETKTNAVSKPKADARKKRLQNKKKN